MIFKKNKIPFYDKDKIFHLIFDLTGALIWKILSYQFV